MAIDIKECQTEIIFRLVTNPSDTGLVYDLRDYDDINYLYMYYFNLEYVMYRSVG